MTGEWDFGPAAIVDLQRQYLRWFDHWLKGTDNGVMTEPLVNIFVMSSNRWLREHVFQSKARNSKSGTSPAPGIPTQPKATDA